MDRRAIRMFSSLRQSCPAGRYIHVDRSKASSGTYESAVWPVAARSRTPVRVSDPLDVERLAMRLRMSLYSTVLNGPQLFVFSYGQPEQGKTRTILHLSLFVPPPPCLGHVKTHDIILPVLEVTTEKKTGTSALLGLVCCFIALHARPWSGEPRTMIPSCIT